MNRGGKFTLPAPVKPKERRIKFNPKYLILAPLIPLSFFTGQMIRDYVDASNAPAPPKVNAGQNSNPIVDVGNTIEDTVNNFFGDNPEPISNDTYQEILGSPTPEYIPTSIPTQLPDVATELPPVISPTPAIRFDDYLGIMVRGQPVVEGDLKTYNGLCINGTQLEIDCEYGCTISAKRNIPIVDIQSNEPTENEYLHGTIFYEDESVITLMSIPLNPDDPAPNASIEFDLLVALGNLGEDGFLVKGNIASADGARMYLTSNIGFYPDLPGCVE